MTTKWEASISFDANCQMIYTNSTEQSLRTCEVMDRIGKVNKKRSILNLLNKKNNIYYKKDAK